MTNAYIVDGVRTAIGNLSGGLSDVRADGMAFLPGFTLFFWAAATWWIPLLIALMVWRYVVRKEVPRYEPALWGMVFPLAMYTTATFQLARATGFEFLLRIPQVFIFIALAAWLIAFAGLLHHIWSSLHERASATSTEPRHI